MRCGLVLAGGLLALAATPSYAQGVNHLALEGNVGVSTFSGNLAKDTAAPTFGLTVAVGQHDWGPSHIAQTLGGLGSLWNLSLTSITAKSKDDTAFPFDHDKHFNVLATSISPTLCALTEAVVQACLGIGWEEFDVQQGSANEQIYGTTLWTLAFGHFLADDLHAGVKLGYRSVVQTVAGTKSSFAVLSVMASLGWQFRT